MFMALFSVLLLIHAQIASFLNHPWVDSARGLITQTEIIIGADAPGKLIKHINEVANFLCLCLKFKLSQSEI